MFVMSGAWASRMAPARLVARQRADEWRHRANALD